MEMLVILHTQTLIYGWGFRRRTKRNLNLFGGSTRVALEDWTEFPSAASFCSFWLEENVCDERDFYRPRSETLQQHRPPSAQPWFSLHICSFLNDNKAKASRVSAAVFLWTSTKSKMEKRLAASGPVNFRGGLVERKSRSSERQPISTKPQLVIIGRAERRVSFCFCVLWWSDLESSDTGWLHFKSCRNVTVTAVCCY